MTTQPNRPLAAVERTVRFGSPEAAKDPDLRAFFAVWEAARAGRAMPAKNNIPPRAIKKYLHLVHLHDVVNGGEDFHCRVVGSDIYKANGIDMSGRMVSTHPDPYVRKRLMDVLQHVARTGKPIHSHAEAANMLPVPYRVVESIALPLGGGDTVEQIIALTVFS